MNEKYFVSKNKTIKYNEVVYMYRKHHIREIFSHENDN